MVYFSFQISAAIMATLKVFVLIQWSLFIMFDEDSGTMYSSYLLCPSSTWYFHVRGPAFLS